MSWNVLSFVFLENLFLILGMVLAVIAFHFVIGSKASDQAKGVRRSVYFASALTFVMAVVITLGYYANVMIIDEGQGNNPNAPSLVEHEKFLKSEQLAFFKLDDQPGRISVKSEIEKIGDSAVIFSKVFLDDKLVVTQHLLNNEAGGRWVYCSNDEKNAQFYDDAACLKSVNKFLNLDPAKHSHELRNG